MKRLAHSFVALPIGAERARERCKFCGAERRAVATLDAGFTTLGRLVLYRPHGGVHWSTLNPRCTR